MKRLWLAALYLVCCPVLSSASPEGETKLDPETKKPYQLEVVLHVARHPLLTQIFKTQVKREIHDGLQAALGDLGEVPVVDKHPLLEKVQEQGLEQALRDWKELSDKKIHVVLIDFADGHYRIQTCQYDGFTGLTSPVRQAGLADPSGRPLVSRMATQLIDRDFGLAGTVEAGAKEPDVRIRLKGGDLVEDTAMKRWVQPGDVFAIAKIVERRGKLQSLPVEWAWLQVLEEPQQGSCRCRLWHRYEQPLRSDPGVRGFRCLKLGTTESRLRLLLVDQKTGIPAATQPLTIGAEGFDSTPEEAVTSEEGLVQTQKSYHNLAFVCLRDKARMVQARIPIAVVDDRPVVCPVNISAATKALADLELEKRSLLVQVNDSLSLASELVHDINRLVTADSHEAALKRAKAGLAELDTEVVRHKTELVALSTRARERKFQDKWNVSDAEERLKELEGRRDKLKDYIDKLQEVIKEEKDPARKEWLAKIQLARSLEDEADFDQAIKLYDEVLKVLPEGGSKPALQKHVAQLKKEWLEAPDEEQKQARRFVYQIWAQRQSAKELSEHGKQAAQVVTRLLKRQDRLALKKFWLTHVTHKATLTNELNELQSQTGEEANKKRRLIGEVSKALEELYKQVGDYLKSAQAEK